MKSKPRTDNCEQTAEARAHPDARSMVVWSDSLEPMDGLGLPAYLTRTPALQVAASDTLRQWACSYRPPDYRCEPRPAPAHCMAQCYRVLHRMSGMWGQGFARMSHRPRPAGKDGRPWALTMAAVMSNAADVNKSGGLGGAGFCLSLTKISPARMLIQNMSSELPIKVTS